MYFCIWVLCAFMCEFFFFFLPLRRAGVLRKCLLKTIPALKSCHSNAWLNGRTHSLPKVFALIFGTVCLKARGVLELRVHAKCGLKSCPLESPAHPQHTRFCSSNELPPYPTPSHPGSPNTSPSHNPTEKSLFKEFQGVLFHFFPSGH